LQKGSSELKKGAQRSHFENGAGKFEFSETAVFALACIILPRALFPALPPALPPRA
jgi:hypothetical protein